MAMHCRLPHSVAHNLLRCRVLFCIVTSTGQTACITPVRLQRVSGGLIKIRRRLHDRQRTDRPEHNDTMHCSRLTFKMTTRTTYERRTSVAIWSTSINIRRRATSALDSLMETDLNIYTQSPTRRGPPTERLHEARNLHIRAAFDGQLDPCWAEVAGDL